MQEALAFSQPAAEFDPTDEEHTTTAFRMGQCLVELGRWEEPICNSRPSTMQRSNLKNPREVQLPSGTRILNKAMLTQWLDKGSPARSGVCQRSRGRSRGGGNCCKTGLRPRRPPPEVELAAKAIERLKPQNTLDAAASLVGRDADFAWFRFVIPAQRVMRDDSPTGARLYSIGPEHRFPRQPARHLSRVWAGNRLV